ncbi:hypothetical protein GPALN_003190 [Globodera pallida]|nr:hypothetical protein GPALN_003190 [Globodera pallida]
MVATRIPSSPATTTAGKHAYQHRRTRPNIERMVSELLVVVVEQSRQAIGKVFLLPPTTLLSAKRLSVEDDRRRARRRLRPSSPLDAGRQRRILSYVSACMFLAPQT